MCDAWALVTTPITLLRHGESQNNREDRFAGWANPPLTSDGVSEARRAGRQLAKEGFIYDVCFTSVLERSVETARIVLAQLGQTGLPTEYLWRLNERHYGTLEGQRRNETRRVHGRAQTLAWRWSWDARPPPIDLEDPRFPGHDPRYAKVDPSELPLSESLEDCSARMLPAWNDLIALRVRQGDRVLVVAHGSSLRALVKHFDSIPDAEIPEFRVPTGQPIVYELGEHLKPVRHYLLQQRPLQVGRWLRRHWARTMSRT